MDDNAVESVAEVNPALVEKKDTNSDSKPRVRQRKLSGDNSWGQKALLTLDLNFVGGPLLYENLSGFCAVDELIATPCANGKVFDSSLYESIQNSNYQGLYDAAFGITGVFAYIKGVTAQYYCRHRETEKSSDFFYFARLYKLFNEQQLKDIMGEIGTIEGMEDSQITYAHLYAVAYFYSPDISKFVGWRRRCFYRGAAKQKLKALEELLKKAPNEKDKQVIIKKIQRKIIEKLKDFLNQENGLAKFTIQQKENDSSIELSSDYAEQIFDQKTTELIKKKAIAEKDKKREFSFKTFLIALKPTLGDASFIYWILMFISCFVAAAPMVASISVIPLLIVFIDVLPILFYRNVAGSYRAHIIHKKIDQEMIEQRQNELLVKRVVELNKRRLLINHLLKKSAGVPLKDSRLVADLETVIKRRWFSRCQVIIKGFVDGCFFPFFAGWLLFDGVKVAMTYAMGAAAVASFNPIGVIPAAIIAVITLALGIYSGVRSAINAYHEHEKGFDYFINKVDALKQEAPHRIILNNRLAECDRLFRRLTDEKPMWTNVKKCLNRICLAIKRLGTGSLVFRLVIWGTITTVLAAFSVSTGLVALYIGTVVFAVAAVAWYLFGYSAESELNQGVRVVEYLVQFEQLYHVHGRLGNDCNQNLVVTPQSVGKKVVQPVEVHQSPSIVVEQKEQSTESSQETRVVEKLFEKKPSLVNRNNSFKGASSASFTNLFERKTNLNDEQQTNPTPIIRSLSF